MTVDGTASCVTSVDGAASCVTSVDGAASCVTSVDTVSYAASVEAEGTRELEVTDKAYRNKTLKNKYTVLSSRILGFLLIESTSWETCDLPISLKSLTNSIPLGGKCWPFLRQTPEDFL